MNLERAKSIFIFVFLGLNLFLGYHLFWSDALRLARVAVSKEELRRTEAKLAGQNYFIDAVICRTVQTSAFLTVSPCLDKQAEIVSRITGILPHPVQLEDALLYRGQGREVKVYPSGLIQIFFEPGEYLAEGSSGLEERKLLLAVDDFLLGQGLKQAQAQFNYVERTPNRLTVHYYQNYHGTPLFAGYLKVTVEGERVTAIELYWLEPLESPLERKMEVIPVTEALLRLVEELGPSPLPRRIVKAELGFFSREYNAEKWEVPPVWRFLTDDQCEFFVNAFTGNLEDL